VDECAECALLSDCVRESCLVLNVEDVNDPDEADRRKCGCASTEDATDFNEPEENDLSKCGRAYLRTGSNCKHSIADILRLGLCCISSLMKATRNGEGSGMKSVCIKVGGGALLTIDCPMAFLFTP